MNKYVKYQNMILRVIPDSIFNGGKSIGTVSLENNLNYYIINVDEIQILSEEEHQTIEVLDS